tara:strand:+ start:3164 stop:3919 length:756 start_codon:yes stop_codon:yes gene_type:complete
MNPNKLFFKDSSFTAFIHRGGAEDATENTLDAFQYSANLGFVFMETDVQSTKDGKIVVFHDDSLKRVAGINKQIKQLDLKQLKDIKLLKGGTIPTLDELLHSFPKLKFNIDIKTHEATNESIKIIRQHNAFDRVCLASFSSKRLKKIRKILNGHLCSSMGMTEVLNLILNSYGLNLKISDGQCAQVPKSYFGIPVLSKRFIDYAHHCSKLVHVWTINNENDMHNIINLGVDGIMTDFPSVLKKVLLEKGLM